MPNSKHLPPLHRLACFGLGLLASIATMPAHAQLDAESRAYFSLAMPPLNEAQTPKSDTGDVLTRYEVKLAPQLASTIDLTVPQKNLWDRIRNGFAMSDLNDSLVLYYQQWYQSRPEALRRMVERSRPYLHYIVDELEARGMPTEIALLPMVESSFNPMAYSRANASGLWQFIPATGKRFKLEQDWWRDDRRSIMASTNAALDYLQTIYEMHGDWQLALASYNWGEGAVKRAVEKNGARGLPTDYPSLTMPNETRHYVPKLQALKNIFGNPALLAQLGIPAIANEPYFATLEAPAPIDVKTAARLANMSLEEFQRLNPSHNRPVIRPETPVVIPADKIDAFRNNLENHSAPLSNWQAYTVTATERLDQIAARFDTTPSELARVNGLSERVRLAAGSTLLVPGVASGPGLANLLNTPMPAQIIAREPAPISCGKKPNGKGAKGASASSACQKAAATAATESRQSPSTNKGKDKEKSAPVAKGSTKTASSSPASTKVAKPGASKPATPPANKSAPTSKATSASSSKASTTGSGKGKDSKHK